MQIKIAHITTVGMSLRYLLLGQLRALEADGYHITAISSPDIDANSVIEAGIRHLPIPISRRLTPLADLVSLWRLYRHMRREHFTIVHTHTPKPGLLGQVAARLAGVPIVINTVHGYYFHERTSPWVRRFYITLEKIAARCSDLIFFVNQEDLATARREKIASAAKLQLLGPGGIGINLKRFDRSQISAATLTAKRAELGIDDHDLVVGFVGRLVKEKGILELLRSMQAIVKHLPNVRLLVIGPVDQEKSDALTSAVARDYGLQDVCIFTGARQNMPELYALMDVFTLPSHREGFPVAPMEASAMGVPCIVTDVRGCRDVVEHGRTGLIVPLDDISGLTQAIKTLLTDQQLAAQMGTAGRTKAIAQFDEQIVFHNVATAYKRLLQRKGLPTHRRPVVGG